MSAVKRNYGTVSRPTIFGRFGSDESGATAIEYGLIVALIFLAIVGSVRTFATSTSEMYGEIETAIDN